MPTRIAVTLPLLICGLVLLEPASMGAARAEGFALGFDDKQPTWKAGFDESRVRVLSHRRHAHIRVSGTASESMEVESSRQGGRIVLEHPVEPARVIDELKLSLWVQSNRGGATLLLRMILPHEKDPATGKVLATYISGETYLQAGKWQQLSCGTSDRLVSEQIVRLRARLMRPDIDTREMYVDQVLLSVDLSPGVTELFIDELRFGPVVSPRNEVPVVTASAATEGVLRPFKFELDQLRVEDRPFLPRIMAWHGESFDMLQQTGVNVAWVPRYDDAAVLSELRQRGMWATATPPRAVTDDGNLLGAREAVMLPFTEATAPILFWNLGTRIPESSKAELVSWTDQVRAADHDARRPLMVDVVGMERSISRQVQMLGVSRHGQEGVQVLHTTFTLKQYRDWLLEKRKLARPGSFVWTWIQTEPAAGAAESRRLAHQTPLVVEPEQIRLQVYAALSAGCRGIGFWKTTRLDGEAPGAAERRFILAQLNMELDLLEPWFATGNVVAQIPFTVNRPAQVQLGQRALDFRDSPKERWERDAILRAQDDDRDQQIRLPTELEAAVLQSHEYGLLLLPVWYEGRSQFVPGQLAANDATMIVSGVPDTASAWHVTTTRIHNLATTRDVGGLRITLPKFDQTAAIVLTSDQSVIQRLRAQIARTAEPSARVSLELARAKLERVREVDRQLKSGTGLSRGGQPDGPQWLASAERRVDLAERALASGDYDSSRQYSDDCLQLLRMLQRAHWNDAIRRYSSPASTAHSVSFQTLPDHWRMIARLGRSDPDAAGNLLRSGDFEDIDTMVVEGWRHSQSDQDGIRATAELHPAARQGKYALRLIAVPAAGKDPPAVVGRSPVSVTTPDVTVQSGQIVYISGWIRVAAPIFGSLDGVTIHDSLGGPAAALRYDTRSNWQRFEMIREVHHSGRLNLTVTLNGIGEVHLDDLQIIAHSPRPETADAPESPEPPSAWSKPFEFWNRVPKLNPLAPRK